VIAGAQLIELADEAQDDEYRLYIVGSDPAIIGLAYTPEDDCQRLVPRQGSA
jgi:hypothetical protein